MNEQEMPQYIMMRIHELVQKCKDGGMLVDSTVDTNVKVVDGNVKYTDTLTITGKFEAIRLDTRPLEQIKEEQEVHKAKVQSQSDEMISKIDEVLDAVEPELVKVVPEPNLDAQP